MASGFDKLYDLYLPEIQRAFLRAMADIVDRAMLDEMIKAIAANDVEALLRASGFTPAALGQILNTIEVAYENSGQAEVNNWPKRIRTPYGVVQPAFNMRNQVIEEDLRKYSSELITNLTNEARESVRMVLEKGMIDGENPRSTALNIVGRVNTVTRKREGGAIGLANNQVRWSFTTKRYLEQLDEKYFTMELRDKRFDGTVRKAIESGKPLNSDTIVKLVTRYNDNALKYRGESIARTETLQSLNRGQDAAIRQAIGEGNITRQQVKKWWNDTGDGRVRISHRLAGKKYTDKHAIDIDEPFVLSTGARLMFPGDQSLGAPAGEVIRCRCKQEYEIDFLLPFAEEV